MNLVSILQIFTLLLFLSHISMTESGYISRMYRVTPSHFITSVREMLTASSALSCVCQCISRYRCGTSAFNTTTKQCFLYVQSQTTKNAIAEDVTVYAQHPWPPCDPAASAAAADPVSTAVTWDPSRWEGKVSCKTDHIYSSYNTTLLCSPEGVWLNDGLCKQSVWNNVPATLEKFPFPRAPQVGGAMCLHLTTCTSCEGLKFDLTDVTGNLLFHLSIMSSANGTLSRVITDSKINKAWIGSVDVSGSSFDYNRSYTLEFRLQDAHTLQILVGGAVIHHHKCPSPSPRPFVSTSGAVTPMPVCRGCLSPLAAENDGALCIPRLVLSTLGLGNKLLFW